MHTQQPIELIKRFLVAGTLTDVTSFTLVLQRNDTNAVVPTTMNHLSTGVYQFLFTPPAGGLTYSAYFTIVYGGQSIVWTDTVQGSCEDIFDYPPLTGDMTYDTLQSLLYQRLLLIRKGPMISVAVHDHRYDLQQFMDHLDKSIALLRKEVAQTQPLEQVGIAW